MRPLCYDDELMKPIPRMPMFDSNLYKWRVDSIRLPEPKPTERDELISAIARSDRFQESKKLT